MLKIALLCLVVALVAGFLGFVVNVAAAIAKLLFFIFLAGFVISMIPHLLGRSKSNSVTKT